MLNCHLPHQVRSCTDSKCCLNDWTLTPGHFVHTPNTRLIECQQEGCIPSLHCSYLQSCDDKLADTEMVR